VDLFDAVRASPADRKVSVATLVLVRHGLTELTGPVLAGRRPGLHLDDRGRQQAAALAERLAGVPLAALVTSPLERCQETVDALADGRPVKLDERLAECEYGDWTGRALKDLAKDPLWKVVQEHPSAAVFPGGEALRDVQNRAVTAVREWDAQVGEQQTWLACSHGDVIKAVVADALGLHLDLFQRLVVDPCSVTVIRYTATRPFVVRLNDSTTPLAQLLAPPPAKARRRRSSDAAVGGGAGS
jgi:probable phosphoglycerate mutase